MKLKIAIVISGLFDLLLFWGMYKLLKKSSSDFQALMIFIAGLSSIGVVFVGLMYGYLIFIS